MRAHAVRREEPGEGASPPYDLYIRARIRRSGPMIPVRGVITGGEPPEPARRVDLPPELAEALIENLTGVAGIPLGIAARFQRGGREYVAPMSIEEASITAGRRNDRKEGEPRSDLDGVEILDVQRILSALANHGLWDDL